MNSDVNVGRVVLLALSAVGHVSLVGRVSLVGGIFQSQNHSENSVRTLYVTSIKIHKDPGLS